MNKNKILGIIIGVVVLVLVVVFVNSKNKNPEDYNQYNNTTDTKNYENTNAVNPVEKIDSDESLSKKVPTKPVTNPNTYTMATVSLHSNAQSCWTTINGNVYDVTSWISQHPGGSAAILRLCGKDGTATFTGKHGGQPRPESELASFKIGTLVN